MSDLLIRVGDYHFVAKLELNKAPRTCSAFKKLTEGRYPIVQARWSGESLWVPLGTLDLKLEPENSCHEPLPGQLLFYPGGSVSETEVLFPYGVTRFACVNGNLSGNHFATITENNDSLAELGKKVMWGGAMEISFRLN